MNTLFIVTYHYIRDLAHSRYPKIKGLDKALFVRQLDFFASHFNVVTMEQVMEAWDMELGGCLPENALLLTFDDGYIDHYLAAYPHLKARGMQGSFFIPGKPFSENALLDVNKIHFILASADIGRIALELKDRMEHYRGREYDFPPYRELYQQYALPGRYDDAETCFVKKMLQTVLPETLRSAIASELFETYVGVPEDRFARELYMDREQIRHMERDGMFIGLHGYDHYRMAQLGAEELRRDTEKMLEVMDGFIGGEGWALSYPYGNYDDTVISYMESKGCRLGVTVEPQAAEIGRDSPFTLPRLDCNDFWPVSGEWLPM